MKKPYQSPETQLVELHIEHDFASSIQVVSNTAANQKPVSSALSVKRPAKQVWDTTEEEE